MASDAAVLAQEWRRLRKVFRAIIGLTCLMAQVIPFHPGSTAVTAFAALFAIYSVVSLLWPRFDRVQASLFALFFESVYFLVFAAYGADRDAWISGLFFLYLMMATAIYHDWIDVFVIMCGSLAFFGFAPPSGGEAFRRTVMVGGLLGCALAYHKRKLQRWLTESARREDAVRGEADKAREQERVRIAGDFHDGPLQSFIALQVRLDILGTLMRRDPAAGMEDLKELQQLSKEIVGDVRSFLRSMRPAEVDASDLVSSVRRIVEYFQKDTGITSRFVCSDTAIKVAPESCHEMLQILREALHNVQKHAKAERVVVSLEQNGKTVELSVDDDGAGFAFSGSFTLDELDLLRLGPASIKRRIRSLGGELSLESRPKHGSSLKIRIPA